MRNVSFSHLLQINKLEHSSHIEIIQLLHSKLLLTFFDGNVFEGHEIRQSILLAFK